MLLLYRTIIPDNSIGISANCEKRDQAYIRSINQSKFEISTGIHEWITGVGEAKAYSYKL